MGFRNDFHGPQLGQLDWIGPAVSALTQGAVAGWQIYSGIEAQEAAERARKSAEAARAKAEEELKKQQEEQKKAQEAQVEQAAAEKEEKILGLPRDAVILGGLGIVTVIGLIAILK